MIKVITDRVKSEPIEVRVFLYTFLGSLVLSLILAVTPVYIVDKIFSVVVNVIVLSSAIAFATQKILGNTQAMWPVYRLMYGITGIERFKQLYDFLKEGKK